MNTPLQIIALLATGGVVLKVLQWIARLYQNIQKAKTVGLPFVIVPWYMYNQLSSMLCNRYLLPLLIRLLPPHSDVSWQKLLPSNWPLKLRYAPFQAIGSDTFFTVAPGGLVLNTADAGVIAQILQRSDDFRKPTWIYSIIGIYGDNIVSSDGEQWKHHRRLSRMAFSERNNLLVWQTTIDRVQDVLATFFGTDITSKTVDHLADHTTNLSLEVLSAAALGSQLVWDNGEEDTYRNGRTMSFSSSLHHIAGSVITLAYIKRLPHWLQARLPFASWRRSYEAYVNWGEYMREMIISRKQAITTGLHKHSTTAVDIIGQLCLGEGGQKSRVLTDSEILGNLFVFIIAGHETTASSLHMCLLFLALRPDIQKLVQDELSQVLGDRPPSKWTYEQDLPRLLTGFLGAVLNEEMRLVTPTLTIPKCVGAVPQSIIVNGVPTEIPANTIIRLCIPSVHVNPNYWSDDAQSDSASSTSPSTSDLEDFRPQRWLRSSKLDTSEPAAERPATLAHPIEGSFMPFSHGKRDCLGRKFAQIEIVTALAVILAQSSVELAVDEWATDEEVGKMTEAERIVVWSKAADKAQDAWRNHMVAGITVQMRRTAHVPMRFVKKGCDRFGSSLQSLQG